MAMPASRDKQKFQEAAISDRLWDLKMKIIQVGAITLISFLLWLSRNTPLCVAAPGCISTTTYLIIEYKFSLST